jgi:Tat protein translocase TatB subunit
VFDLGIQELVVIFAVALIVFGPKRLPELGRTIGKGLLELRKAMEGVKEQIQAESELSQESTQTLPKEKSEESGDKAGAAPEAAGIAPEGEEKKGGTGNSHTPSENDNFYRSDEEDSRSERKEDQVNGR